MAVWRGGTTAGARRQAVDMTLVLRTSLDNAVRVAHISTASHQQQHLVG